jgi:hypothetical protein
MFFFFSPALKSTGGGIAESAAKAAIRVARGALLLFGGHTMADQRLFGATLKLTDPPQPALSTPVVENYAFPNKFLFCSAESVELVSRRICHNPSPENRRRISLALTFLERASSEMDVTVRFTSMWIAMEVVAGGYGKIEKLIEQTTGDSKVRSHLKEIKVARDQLFHHGQRYTLSQEQEKLICAVIAAKIFRDHGVSDRVTQSYLHGLAQENISGHPHQI